MTSDTNTHAEQQQEPERKHQHVNIEIDRTKKITGNHAQHYAGKLSDNLNLWIMLFQTFAYSA